MTSTSPAAVAATPAANANRAVDQAASASSRLRNAGQSSPFDEFMTIGATSRPIAEALSGRERECV